MNRAASRASLQTLQDALGTFSRSRATTSVQLTPLSEEFYAIARLLVAQSALRRGLTDPAVAPQQRGQLIRGLLDGKVSESAVSFAEQAAQARWSSSWDLADAFDQLGDQALLSAAESDHVLDDVEDELFRFERILAGEPELSAALDEKTVDSKRRVTLLSGLLGGRVQPITLALLEHAVGASHSRGIQWSVEELVAAAAGRKDRAIARVLSAVPLSHAQETRLAKALSEMYNRHVAVRTAVDASVQGGLVIYIGDEVIDGSVAGRLAAARSALSGSS